MINSGWLPNLNRGCTQFPHSLGACMNILFITKAKVLCSLNGYIDPLSSPNHVNY